MRVIAGSAGGLRLKSPRSGSRPTADRVREALFSILGARVAGARVLDLFAGSGALGIEALSRGAESCVMVDSDREATETARANAATARLADRASIAREDVFRFLRRAGSGSGGVFDIIFADPPYRKREDDRDFAAELVAEPALAAMLAPDGVVVLESMADARRPAPKGAGALEAIDRRTYGSTTLTFFHHAAPVPGATALIHDEKPGSDAL